ncbi:hcp protein [Caballeronia calidae]|uniref:Hcp protein n=1 Tax=Caballeronia calidae TaxID=1777139 RepID=A0A158DY46_9BURK|nr:hcp protein [Caballeronia calidae]
MRCLQFIARIFHLGDEALDPVVELELEQTAVEIKWYKIDDAGKEKKYFNTRLDNFKVVAVRPKMLDIKVPDYEKHTHLEEIERRYEQITWSYKDGNIIHKDTWNERS